MTLKPRKLFAALLCLCACDKLPPWLATEKPPAPVPTAAPSASAPAAPEPPAVDWAGFKGPPDAVLDATRITLRVEGQKSYSVSIEHDGTVAFSAGSGCGTRTIPTANIGTLLAFIRTNGFFALKPTYNAEGAPSSTQDEVKVSVRTPGTDVLVVAERGSHPPKAFTNIAGAIAAVSGVDAQLPKLKAAALTQDDVERAVHKDKARLAKCKKATSVAISIDKLGVTSLEGVTPSDEGPCVLPIVTSWKFAPACSGAGAHIELAKAGPTVTLTPGAH